MAIRVFFLLSKRGSQTYKNCKQAEPHNVILPGTIFKVWVRNICEIFRIQYHGCQLLSKFFDNMDYIIINQSHTSQSQFFQVLTTLSNNTDIFRT